MLHISPTFHIVQPRKVWGLAFSAAGQADTFAFSLQGALEALGLEEERRREEKEEQMRIKEGAMENGNEVSEGGWSPRRER